MLFLAKNGLLVQIKTGLTPSLNLFNIITVADLS